MVLRALLAGCLFLTSSLIAQDTAAPTRGSFIRPEPRAIGIEIRPAKGRPFSGRDCIEGSYKSRVGDMLDECLDGPLLARDSHGRIRREIRSARGSEYTVVLDPVAHRRVDCEIAKRACIVLGYDIPASVNPPPEGTLDNDHPSLAHESLGTNVIEGLDVTGLREMIPAIDDRDGRPRLTELEFWYSSELEIDLSVTRKYSNGNSLVIHVVSLSRAEPDPALFQIPSGFAVQDRSAPPHN
jgi:hypothetical protein